MSLESLVLSVIAALTSGACSYHIKNKSIRNVVFGLVLISIFILGKVYVIPRYEIWSDGITLQKNNHDFKLMAQAVPEEYWAYVKEMRRRSLDGTFTTEWAKHEALGLFGLAERRVKQFASDESIYSYYLVDYKINKKLFDINPMLMQKRVDDNGGLFISDQASNAFDKVFTPQNDEEILNSMREVIASGIKHEGTPLNEETRNKAKNLANSLNATIDKIYGKDEKIDLTNSGGLKRKEEKLLAYEKGFLEMGKENLGLLSRYLDEGKE